MELHPVRNKFRFLSGNMLVSSGKMKLLKPEFSRKISESESPENGKLFD